MATITTDETTLLFFYIAAVLLTHGFVREVHRAIVRAARAASVGEDERIDSQDVRSLQAQNVREEPVHVSCRDQSVELSTCWNALRREHSPAAKETDVRVSKKATHREECDCSGSEFLCER